MSTTNVQIQISRQQAEGPEEEQQHGKTKGPHQQQEIRRRGGGTLSAVTTTASRSPAENSIQGRRCARCGGALGRFYNTGASCPRCRHRVCRQCREFRGSNGPNNKGDHASDWLCAVCHRIAELRTATGDWIYEAATLTNPRLVAAKKNSPVDIIKRSIRRAWTINGPPARWSVARKSPAFRVYRSLPLREKNYQRTHEDVENIEDSCIPLSKRANDRDDDNSQVTRVDDVEDKTSLEIGKDDADEDSHDEGGKFFIAKTKKNVNNEEATSTKKNDKKLEHSTNDDVIILDTSKRRKKIEQTDNCAIVNVENSANRVSLIKPPRIIGKNVTNENKQTIKHGDRKSNIPIFRRNSREFEDIGSPQETTRRSLIPQRYRGSTDDLRRSREDISLPSLIPKLFSPRNKEQDKLKRQDSRDDVRHLSKGNRRDSGKEENRTAGFSTFNTRDEQKSGIRIFRRDSREDVGRETTSLPSLCVVRARQANRKDDGLVCRDVKDRVGDTITRSKSCPSEQVETRDFTPENTKKETKSFESRINENLTIDDFPTKLRDEEETVEITKMANEQAINEERLVATETKTVVSEDNVKSIEKNSDHMDLENDEDIEKFENSVVKNFHTNELIEPVIKNKETIADQVNCSETDFSGAILGDKKSCNDLLIKRTDDVQVVRRKFSKEEFSNPDDTDETPNRRSSSHLSPEASPLSTRSSRYSPRESESEPTPALPRKIGSGDSCTASQRIRDAITRTRRESNSSARYESSGSESIRLSESGLHSYADLARRVKLFGSGGNGPGPLLGNDEPVQRDSATSAGEDEPHEDCHSRGTGSSQGRTMLRRRRQFDAQGSRRRGRSHARNCCGEELQNLQALNVIGRGGGGRQQQSPTQNQETPNPDYRRLVFISSDSSSGREEDDADSSCSGSSYLNGLPRNNHQSLEDCDWDYFESGTLPLPNISDATSLNVGQAENSQGRDWSCCPGRGSTACLACGGSPGANVLPVPVPIPVPVPYPVPVPASLWTGDFAAAASSMITRGATPEGTLRLRGDPSAPWFSWHPRFNQPLGGARIDPRVTIGGFDPSAFGFRPEEITPRIYSPTVEENLDSSLPPTIRPGENPVADSRDESLDVSRNVQESSASSMAPEEPRKPENLKEFNLEGSTSDQPIIEPEVVSSVEESETKEPEIVAEVISHENNQPNEQSNDESVDSSQDSSSSQENDDDDDDDDEDRMYRNSHEDSGSSSGRSSADSSDLEDSASHRFSRVFVVNDDSLTSDNEIEDNEDSDSAREGLVTVKRVTSLPDVEPVVLRRVRLLDEDMNVQREPGDPSNPDERRVDQRVNRIERKIDLLAERDPDANEIYLASSTDHSESSIQLKSIKNLNPDVVNIATRRNDENFNLSRADDTHDDSVESKNWDSVITPDSLEIVEDIEQNNAIREISKIETTSNRDDKSARSSDDTGSTRTKKFVDNDVDTQISEDKSVLSAREESLSENELNEVNDVLAEISSRTNPPVNSFSTTDSSETCTTGSEMSSDELHEYEISPGSKPDHTRIPITNLPTVFETPRNKLENSSRPSNVHKLTPMPRRSLLEALDTPKMSSENSPIFVSTPIKDSTQPSASPRTRKIMETIDLTENGVRDEEAKNSEARSVVNETACPTPMQNVGDIISSRIHEIFKNSSVQEARKDSASASPRDGGACAVRGEKPEVRNCQVGVSEVVERKEEKGEVVDDGGGGGNECAMVDGGGGGNEEENERGGSGASARFRSVERRPPTRKENGCFPSNASSSSISSSSSSFGGSSTTTTTTTREQARTGSNYSSNNKYRSLVMITQGAYQPVSVITSDTTTLLQAPNDEVQSSQGLAGYFHLALESTNEANSRNGQAPRRPLMVKRLVALSDQQQQEIDSGLSVGSASESDDVQSVKSQSKCIVRETCDLPPRTIVKEDPQSSPRLKNPNLSPLSSDDNSTSSGLVILEEGLADDDSWVEEVSHDEDEQSATTATEESSEDEANNLGDREEELRGYHRQAIDFTLHTIVEESCEESEAEPSLATASPRKKRPPSASELEKYFFFGLGGDGNANGTSSREIDSLSETSSIYSEGLESLGQEDNNVNSENKGSNEFLNSSRLEKYFLSEFLGFDQDRRDSDGSVGSDSEGHPSPEAQRRKRLVRARGTGRSSHSSSLDNLLALAQGTQNLSSQNSLQDLSGNQDSLETQSEGSSTETDGADDGGQTPAFGTDGQFDTVKRKKKKPRNLGTQSPRVTEDRNKTPEPREILIGDLLPENDSETINSEDERAKTPQPESSLHSSSSSSSQMETGTRGSQASSSDNSSSRGKQQSRDSGFVGSCDDLLQHQKSSTSLDSRDTHEAGSVEGAKDSRNERSHRGVHENEKRRKSEINHHDNQQSSSNHLQPPPNASLSRKDSFNNWSSDEETNLMMSKLRQFFKTMVVNTNGQMPAGNSSGPSPAPSPRLSGYTKARLCSQNRTKPPQLVYFENELTRLMKTVPGIRDEQVREIVEYLSSEDTWSDSYDSSDYTSSDLEGAAGGRRSALQEQISQSCQQIINKFDSNCADTGRNVPTSTSSTMEKPKEEIQASSPQPCLGRDTAFVYQKLVQSFTKIAGDGPASEANSTPHSSPPLIAKVMHHIGSRLVALMHEVSEGGPTVQPHSTWRRYSQHHHRTPSSASTTEDDDSTSDSTNPPTTNHLPRSKSHDPLLLINGHPANTSGQEGEEREASDYERFSWRGSFESALMAADSRTKLSLLACSGDVSASASASALAMAAKRRSAGDLLFNPKSFSREQLDRVRSCGSIGGGGGGVGGSGGSIEEKIWTNRRRSSVPDANTRGESGASAGDDDTEDELEYGGDPRATTLPRGMQAATGASAATNSLPRLPASTSVGGVTSTTNSSSPMHKAHSVYHFLPQHTGVKSARYRPPGFARNSLGNAGGNAGPKRAVSAPGLQVSGSQVSAGKRENSRTRRQQQAISLTPDDGSSLSEACSTPIIGAGSRAVSSNTVMDIDDMDRGLHSGHLATRASLSSLGARSDSMASVYSGAGEGRWCGSVAVRGEVEFSLQYDYKQLTFEVHVTQCKDLAPVDIKRNRSDPYVKVYLLPDKSKSGKRKTKVKKHTLNPVFDETLKFHMSLNGLETRTLWLTVWHSDMFGRNDFLGEVRMPLENKIFDDPTPRWYPLQERTEPFDDPIAYKGEVIVGLKFVPPDPAQLERDRETSIENRGPSKGRKNWSRGSLHVLVKEARNLQTRAKNSGTCDPFCKSYLLPDKGRSGKQKTGVVRRSGGSPVWGHTFVYKDVSLQELAERGLELTVWDHDRIASNEFLGGVRFNLGTGKHYGKVVDWMDATGREMSLWQSMIERPNFWVEGAVTLRPNLHNHGKSGGP